MNDAKKSSFIQVYFEGKKDELKENSIRNKQHMTKINDLKENPCKKVIKMGKSDANNLEFWTKAEAKLKKLKDRREFLQPMMVNVVRK